ncbi:uncharacterized protein LOC111390509 [Olea europaea var. sylvestris]|uniref:uncharacterized protein LOC111390509 n=1 Tax=Olea europaea var. sylvestris TaxID=158386 RepID=UPI000C1D393E|nr:uncharacterized protein LOC111390509 [Olea europaea var. sylvestris]
MLDGTSTIMSILSGYLSNLIVLDEFFYGSRHIVARAAPCEAVHFSSPLHAALNCLQIHIWLILIGRKDCQYRAAIYKLYSGNLHCARGKIHFCSPLSFKCPIKRGCGNRSVNSGNIVTYLVCLSSRWYGKHS